MLKNIQFNKIILALFIIGIIIISGLGIFFLNLLQTLNEQIGTGQAVDIQELQTKTVYVLGICGILFAMVGILTAALLSRFIIYPINKLIKSAERITEEDKNGEKKVKGKKVNATQDLQNVLGLMTTELKDKTGKRDEG